MLKKVLVANRGEIAVRIIRALREMDIKSVAIYSEADRHALHTELADEAICIGPAKTLDSYGNPIAVISAALVTGADAIHPGYGFLSEKSDFVQLCEEVGIKFIGPSSQIIDIMGNKDNARQTMDKAGVPIVPGSKGLIHTLEEARALADEIGYPIMVKASDGGGGKGMRRVNTAEELETKFNQAQFETQSIYGNKDLYIEKVIQPAKHIEVQLLGDEFGNVIHLGERDCSVQRNQQKLIEIAPAIGLPDDVRQRICQSAVQAAKAIGYTNAGTIEFLVDPEGNYYFMEMNTRLQVEHPISEMITGVDIVREQINIAGGGELSVKQDEIEFKGVAIECRVNAEDPRQGFRPQAGHVEHILLPSGGMGVRVETALYSNYTIPSFYDSMIAKIIVHQPNAEMAFKLMQRALYEFNIRGVVSNIELLEALVVNKYLQKGETHTNWFEESFYGDWLRIRQMIDDANK